MPGELTPHVLVVDDDPFMREILNTILEHAGFRVTLAGCVREGLAALRRECPALVVTDLAMPDGTGQEILQAANEFEAPPPVIVTSGSLPDSRAVDQELIRAGARHLLPKPFGVAEFLTIVHSTVGL